jgi:predicted site-specific integrase-resolvase
LFKKTRNQKKWLRVSEVKEVLKISASTIQTLRINGSISFTKISGMYYYNYEDIEKLINNNFKEVEKQPKVFKIKRCKN